MQFVLNNQRVSLIGKWCMTLFGGKKLFLCSSKKLPEICTERKTKSVKILSLESSDQLLHCVQCVLIYSDYEARSVFNYSLCSVEDVMDIRKIVSIFKWALCFIGVTGVTFFVAF